MAAANGAMSCGTIVVAHADESLALQAMIRGEQIAVGGVSHVISLLLQPEDQREFEERTSFLQSPASSRKNPGGSMVTGPTDRKRKWALRSF
jgi:hypothetical protein